MFLTIYYLGHEALVTEGGVMGYMEGDAGFYLGPSSKGK